jgi:hypothetical protein
MRVVVLLICVALILTVLLPLLRRRAAVVAVPVVDELVKDPVCQTYIVRSRAVRRSAPDGPRYFCSAECARRASGA